MQVVENFEGHGLETRLGYLDSEQKTVFLSFKGVLDLLSAENVFIRHRSSLKKWFENRKETTRAVFDLFYLTHINSYAIGHLTQFYLILYKAKVPVTLVVNPESTAYQILDYCGLFELYGLQIQVHSLNKGLDEIVR